MDCTFIPSTYVLPRVQGNICYQILKYTLFYVVVVAALVALVALRKFLLCVL